MRVLVLQTLRSDAPLLPQGIFVGSSPTGSKIVWFCSWTLDPIVLPKPLYWGNKDGGRQIPGTKEEDKNHQTKATAYQ